MHVSLHLHIRPPIYTWMCLGLEKPQLHKQQPSGLEEDRCFRTYSARDKFVRMICISFQIYDNHMIWMCVYVYIHVGMEMHIYTLYG